MRNKKFLLPILLVAAFFISPCAYIVLPEGLEPPQAASKDAAGWSAVVTGITTVDTGNLHFDITIRNDSGDWSAMKATEGKPVVLKSSGTNTTCDSVFLSTGGHRLAPGFQMRGFISGSKAEPMIQEIFVECGNAEIPTGATLSIPYSYVTGQYNYYEQDKNKVDDRLEINLDEVFTDLTYPIAEAVDDLIQGPETEIIALNDVTLHLVGTQRTEDGFTFTWVTNNPGEYPTYVHIGHPPVIGADGILYGYYETPDIVSVPITPAGDDAEWTTEVSVPNNVDNFYIMLSVETGKARLFANYAVDITGY
jgi:hypothetical protein